MLQSRTDSPEAMVKTDDNFMVGESPSIIKIRELVAQVADTDLNVLICGESGVGKELVARALHFQSRRVNRVFVKVNCAAIPAELLESELFGYERGAFTGADKAKPGKFELADNGTLLLDEIGDMSPKLQAKLLQVLQDGCFTRLGGKSEVRVNTWIMAATNHDLERDIQEGSFREDLYYRLNIVKIWLPPLRERREDIAVLIRHFLNELQDEYKDRAIAPDLDLYSFLLEYPWPGNVRELKNTLRRLVILGDADSIVEELKLRASIYKPNQKEVHPAGASPVPTDPHGVGTTDEFLPLKEVKRRASDRAERRAILEALQKTHWNRKRAADLLQISYKALLYKIKDFNIDAD